VQKKIIKIYIEKATTQKMTDASNTQTRAKIKRS